MTLIDKIRAAEPAWLAQKRKAIIGPIPGAVVAIALRYGIHVDELGAELIGLAVASFFTWLIPNKTAATVRPTA